MKDGRGGTDVDSEGSSRLGDPREEGEEDGEGEGDPGKSSEMNTKPRIQSSQSPGKPTTWGRNSRLSWA